MSFDEDDIEAHGFSDWSTKNSTGRAVAIVYPQATDDVSKVAAVCTKYSVPMSESALISEILYILGLTAAVPYGAGSSIEGNFSAPYSGIVIDMAQMDNIIAFHPVE